MGSIKHKVLGLSRGSVTAKATILVVTAGLALTQLPLAWGSDDAQPADLTGDVVEYVGSTEITAEEAQERADEIRDAYHPEKGSYVPGHVIMSMFPGSGIEAVETAAASIGASEYEMIFDATEDTGGIYSLTIPKDKDVADCCATLLENTQVQSAYADRIMTVEDSLPVDVTDEASEEAPEDQEEDAKLDVTDAPDEATCASIATIESAQSDDETSLDESQEQVTSAFIESSDNARIEAATPWERTALDYDGAWAVAKDADSQWNGSSDVTVAVIDTGVQTSHNDLQANVLKSVDVREWSVDSGTEPAAAGEPALSHGTSVAGIISACYDNGVGHDGLSRDAKILSIRVTGLKKTVDNQEVIVEEELDTRALLKAFQYLGSPYNGTSETVAKHYKVKVVNLSFGLLLSNVTNTVIAQDEINSLLTAAKSLTDKGILIVNSAGNLPSPSQISTYGQAPYDHWPTTQLVHNGQVEGQRNSSGVIGTIGLNKSLHKSSSTNWNKTDDYMATVSAPDTDISVITLNNATSSVTGTSFAAPFVSATGALMFSVNSSLSAADAQHIIEDTTTDIDNPGHDRETGYGMLTPKVAVEAAIAANTGKAHESNLGGMQLYIDNAKQGSFSYKSSGPYSKGYGVVSQTPQCRVDFIDCPSDWTKTVTENHKTPVRVDNSDSTIMQYALDKVFTFTSNKPDINGQPIQKTYTVSFTWSISNPSVEGATTDLAGTTVNIDGKPYSEFSLATPSYDIQCPSKSAVPATAPTFHGLPSGWTVSASQPITNKQLVDNGNGTGTENGVVSYTLTATNADKTKSYSYTFNFRYTDLVQTGSVPVPPVDSPTTPGDPASGDQPSSQGQAPGAAADSGTNGTSAGGTGTSSGGTSSGSSSGSSSGASKGNTGELKQTGDPIVWMCGMTLAATAFGLIATRLAKGRHSA